ncbi:MAG: site-specific tyrosine recombinase XerD [Bacteroidales bacterium]|nr:site-specific tyrosine recombinase XerD [Bacteroidales bacterium]
MQQPIIHSSFKTYLRLERGLSDNTLEAYLHDVELLFRFLAEEKNGLSYQKVQQEDLRDFLQHIHRLGLSAYTQSRILSGIKSFYGFLMQEKEVEINPTALIESPKLGMKLPEVLSLTEVEKIIHSVDLSLPEGERNKAILEVLYGCGLRVSELVNLRLSYIHFNENVIRVTGKGDKQRLIPLGEPAKKQMLTYITHVRNHITPKKGAEDIVFLNRTGGKLSRQMVFIMVRKQCVKAGIKKVISPHTFRHSFATHLVQNGADLRAVQELLGHVSITTTEIYTHLNIHDLRKTILNFHPRNH